MYVLSYMLADKYILIFNVNNNLFYNNILVNCDSVHDIIKCAPITIINCQSAMSTSRICLCLPFYTHFKSS